MSDEPKKRSWIAWMMVVAFASLALLFSAWVISQCIVRVSGR